MKRCDLIVDGNALFAIGFFSRYRNLDAETDRADRECAGIVSAARRLYDLIIKRGYTPDVPENLLVCFDGKAKSDKKRSPKPPGYYDQLSRFIDAIPTMFGGAAYVATGAEADDAVASALQWKRGNDVVIVSTDKDLYQLVTPRVRYFCLRRKRMIEVEEFLKKIPCRSPHLLPIYLALAGDAIDGISGVRGVGPRRAGAIIEAMPADISLKQAIHYVGKQFTRAKRVEYYEAILCTTLFGDHEGTPQPTQIKIPGTRELRKVGLLGVAQEASRARNVLEELTETGSG